MKKVFGIILAVMISITSVMFDFSWLNHDVKTANAEVVEQFQESELKNKVDIVDPVNLNGSLSYDSKENQSIFDYDNEKLREGKVIVPKTKNTNKDIESIYQVKEFSVSFDDSIFIWIFIPDNEIYNLSISFFSNNGEKINWFVSRANLTLWLNGAKINNFTYGWRLFEFCVSDAEMLGEVKNNLTNIEFNNFKVEYYSDEGIIVQDNNNSFAFFSIQKANKFSNFSHIVASQEYVVYKFNQEFLKDDNVYFINEEIIFTSVSKVFEYLIVGEINLKDYSNSNYFWEINIIDPNGKKTDKVFGEKYIFENIGYHSIQFKLKQFVSTGSDTIMFFSTDVYADYYVLGAFTNVDYEVDTNETKLITFNISSYFEITSDINVEVIDKSLATVTYYIEDGVCYIELTGVSEGETKISVSAEGVQPGNYEPVMFKCSTSIKVKNLSQKSTSEVILLVVLGCYGVSFIIFVVISLVKSRHISVK